MIKRLLLAIARRTPHVKQYITKYPPGHYYSTVPDKDDIKRRYDQIYKDIEQKEIVGIDLNYDQQQQLIRSFKTYYDDHSLQIETNEVDSKRYYGNGMFGVAEALYLQFIIRHYKPKKIIEVGSGFSSAVTLDTRDSNMDKSLNCTFIEPYPERLHRLLSDEDRKDPNVEIVEDFVQSVDVETLTNLEANDILFIDSSHITKLGSDVNYLFFEVLPRLKPGVIIHIHDIPFPFEYHKRFFLPEGRAFNEVYLLRAMLMNSPRYEIIAWPHHFALNDMDWLKENMPALVNNGQYGGSIWLKVTK